MASDDKRCEEKNDKMTIRTQEQVSLQMVIAKLGVSICTHTDTHTHAWPNIFSFDRSKKRDVIGLMFVFYMLVRWGSYFYVCLCVYICVFCPVNSFSEHTNVMQFQEK